MINGENLPTLHIIKSSKPGEKSDGNYQLEWKRPCQNFESGNIMNKITIINGINNKNLEIIQDPDTLIVSM